MIIFRVVRNSSNPNTRIRRKISKTTTRRRISKLQTYNQEKTIPNYKPTTRRRISKLQNHNQEKDLQTPNLQPGEDHSTTQSDGVKEDDLENVRILCFNLLNVGYILIKLYTA